MWEEQRRAGHAPPDRGTEEWETWRGFTQANWALKHPDKAAMVRTEVMSDWERAKGGQGWGRWKLDKEAITRIDEALFGLPPREGSVTPPLDDEATIDALCSALDGPFTRGDVAEVLAATGGNVVEAYDMLLGVQTRLKQRRKRRVIAPEAQAAPPRTVLPVKREAEDEQPAFEGAPKKAREDPPSVLTALHEALGGDKDRIARCLSQCGGDPSEAIDLLTTPCETRPEPKRRAVIGEEMSSKCVLHPHSGRQGGQRDDAMKVLEAMSPTDLQRVIAILRGERAADKSPSPRAFHQYNTIKDYTQGLIGEVAMLSSLPLQVVQREILR
eukprot:Sspe_Gene.22951::Locus_8836_Transcript_2_3_Confidence_0.400_Length_1514::g.22951::m.22951